MPLEPRPQGWFEGTVSGASDGTPYALVLEDGRVRPDPSSRRQPDGVHGPSALFDAGRHAWQDPRWRGLELRSLVFYELHVGTFTEEGTLDAAAKRLPGLADLGVTCVELMPVQPFAGERNWGYDGVLPYAVHERYGGPAALQRFVDRAHALGLAVCLDVVYNHLGPEGNYTSDFAPYFTSRHRTLWGDGFDYDGPHAAPVRSFMIGAAVQWVRDFHVDALRLDATHAIEDGSGRHLVAELRAEVAEAARAAGRLVHVIAEDERNERSVLDPPPGWGCSAVWADDLHHAIHALLTGERESFLADYGKPDHVRRALAAGFAYQGEHSPYHGGPRGSDPSGLAPPRFITCLQNHDQVGNRPRGERIATLVPWPALYPASALVLLGSGTPLLFMGEEYGETRPFQYFTSHGDAALAKAVSEGRRNEFIAKGGGDDVPDPQDPATFARSKLTHRRDGRHGELREHYRRMLALRRKHLDAIASRFPEVEMDGTAFTLRREGLTVRANLGAAPAGGLGPWGLEIEESAPQRAEPVDPPHTIETGDGQGLAP